MKKTAIVFMLLCWCSGFISAQFRVEEDPVDGEFLGIYDKDNQLHIVCKITCEEECTVTIKFRDPITKMQSVYCKNRLLRPGKEYFLGYGFTKWNLNWGDQLIVECEGYGKYTVELPKYGSKEYVELESELLTTAQNKNYYQNSEQFQN